MVTTNNISLQFDSIIQQHHFTKSLVLLLVFEQLSPISDDFKCYSTVYRIVSFITPHDPTGIPHTAGRAINDIIYIDETCVVGV